MFHQPIQTMKRMTRFAVLATVMTVCMTATAAAQDFYWGPKVGLNVSGLTKTTYSKSRARANFGLHAGYVVGDLLGIQAEALYSLQGNKVSNDDNHRYSYNYFKIPVVAKVYLIGGLNVEAGVSFNWLVRAQETWKDGDGVKHTITTKQGLKNFDLTIPVGVNYTFLRFLELGVRYDISTVRLPEEKKNHAKNSNWSINAALRF